MLAFDIRTGVMTSFAPTFNGEVQDLAITPDGTKLIAVGTFTSVNNQTRNRVAVFNLPAGTLSTTVVPNLNGPANSVAATNSTIYLGGYFGTVNGATRARVAAVRTSNGSTLPFTAPVDNRQVLSIVVAPDEKSVVISGSFTSVGGSSNPGYGLARLDALSGAMLPLPVNAEVRDAGDNSSITRLKSDGTRFYGVGWHYGRGGNVEGFFAANWSDGSLAWIEDCHGDTYDIATVDNVSYTASHAHYCGNSGGFPQTNPGTNRHLGAWTADVVRGINKADIYDYPDHAGKPRPAILNWFPTATAGTFTEAAQATWSVTGNSDYVVYGGEFTKIGPRNQQGLVRFARRGVGDDLRGPRLTSTDWVPTLKSYEPGSVRIDWLPNYDEDDSKLTYTVYRNTTSNPIYQTDQDAMFWRASSMYFEDTGLDPGTPVQYRVRATDPWGNVANSDWITITPSGGTTLDTYSRAVLEDNPVKYWRLDEASGTAVNDLAGTDNTVLTGTVSRNVAGAVPTNGATQFTGSSSARAISTQLIAGPMQFTAEAWFRTSSNNGGKIVGFGSSATGSSGTYDRDLYLDSSRRVSFSVRNRSSRIVLRTNTTFNDNQWHLATGVFSPDEMSLYVDGKLVSTRTDLPMDRELNGYWRVGGDTSASGSAYFTGSIDDVAIYDTALSATKVRDHYVASGRSATAINQPPVADFSVSVDGRTASFNASASTDPDGSIASYSWDFGDSSSGTGVSPTRTYSTGTGYWVTLTVTDNNGVTSSIRKPVAVSSNRSPKPAFSSSVVGLTASFDSAGTTDPDGTLTNLQWSYGDGTFGSGATSSHTYDQGGTYDVTLTATDDLGAVSTLTKQVTVQQAPNQNPTAAFTATPSGATVAFDGSGSSDPDGSIASYAWNFGDGSSGTGATPSKTYAASGTYNVTLTVTDNRGGTATLTKPVGVTVPNQKPTARYTFTTNQLTASFDATTSSDPEGPVASYAWDFGDGGTSTSATPNHPYAQSGTYQVALTVTDGQGATDTVTKAVTVYNALAVDTFERTVANGWGTADVGGAWTTTGTASRFSVSGGAGRLQVPSGSLLADLPSVDSSDDQVAANFSVDKVAEGTYIELRGRKIGAAFYAARIRVSADGTARLYLLQGETGLGANFLLPFTITANTRYNLVMATSGTSPTTLSAKAWPASGTEPAAWQLTRTDTTAALQAKGAIGVRGYLPGSSSASSPVTVSFHDLTVTGVGNAPAQNAKPVAAFTATPSQLSVDFDGTGSSDSDGSVASYAWNFGDGSTGTGPSPTHVYASADTYQVTLTVTDDKGATSTPLTKPVTVSAGNQKPVANFTSTTNQLTASFNGTSSSDPDGSVASYAWEFGDGSTGTGASPSHPYAAAGTYQVTLTVTDNQGATSDPVMKSVTVQDSLAADAFERTVASGWGTADSGGPWTLTGSAARFSVGGGAGQMSLLAGNTLIGDLNNVSSRNDRVAVRFSVDKVVDGTYIELRGRKVGTDFYAARIRVSADGTARLYLLQGGNGLGANLLLPFTITAGSQYNFVLDVSGTSPTTLSTKAWPVGDTEPAAWQLVRTDTFAALQTAGAVGLRGYLPGAATQAPVTISFHDFLLTGTNG